MVANLHYIDLDKGARCQYFDIVNWVVDSFCRFWETVYYSRWFIWGWEKNARSKQS